MVYNDFSMSYNLLANSVNQVIYFPANCLSFLTKFRMPQERKSRFCGISTIFFQYCFMSETQVLMTISNFSELFLQIISWKGFIFKWEGHRGETINFDGGRGVKKSQDGGGGGQPFMGNPEIGGGRE